MSKLSKKPSLTLDSSLVQDDLPLEVVPHIFLGSIHSAFNIDALVSHNITHILNASRMPITFPKQFTYLSVEIRDKDDANLLTCIPTTNIFIEGCLDQGAGILIHCFGGKSRSPAFIAAYIMSSNNWTFDEAYNLIKVVRPSADINAGFESQLRAYAAANYDVFIAQQLLLRTRVRDLFLLRDTNIKDEQYSKPKSFQSTISIDTSFAPSKPVRCNSRQKRALSEAPLAELQTDLPYQSPIEKDGIGSAVTDGSCSISSHCSSFSGFRENSLERKFGNRSIDVDTSVELDESIASLSSEPKVPLKSPFNSKATLTTQSTGTTHSSYSLASNEPISYYAASSTVSASINRDIGHVSSGNSSCASDNMLDESQDSLYSIGSNGSFENFGKGSAGAADSTGRPKGKKIHRIAETSEDKQRLERFQHENRNLAIHPANETNPNNSIAPENQVNSSKFPTCKLSRPMSNWIRIIPPLIGLEREFKCSWCNASLFQLANVIRVDIENIQVMLEAYQHSMKLFQARGSTYSKLKRDFDDVIPQDELEEAFLQQSNQQANQIATQTASYNDMVGSHLVDSTIDSSVSFLPPITKKNSQKPIGGFSVGFAAPRYDEEGGGDHAIMDVDEEYSKPFFPLKTSRANSKSNRGFTFESSSMDDNDVALSSLKQPQHCSSSSSVTKGSFRTPHKDISNSDGKMDPVLAQTYPALTVSKSFNSIPKISSSGNSPADVSAIRQSPRLLPAIQIQSSPPSHEKTHRKALLGVNTNQQYPSAINSTLTITSGIAPLYDESPRVSIPPHKLLPENNFSCAPSRPSSANGSKSQSAEKRRWLARLNLLRDSNIESVSNGNKNIKNRISNISEADDLASQHYINDPTEKYFYVEYLPWMGGEIFQYPKDHGEICCPGCSRVVGSWSWNPSPRLLRDGRLEAPLFRIHKRVVHHSEFDFDSTPSSTPRPSEDFVNA